MIIRAFVLQAYRIPSSSMEDKGPDDHGDDKGDDESLSPVPRRALLLVFVQYLLLFLPGRRENVFIFGPNLYRIIFVVRSLDSPVYQNITFN